MTNIKHAYDGQCKPYNSIPREGTANASKKFPRLYEFSRNIHLYELKEKVVKGGFKILNQILNYDGRVIGIFIEKEDEERSETFSGIVMCEPSSLDKTIPEINYIDDESLWRPYEETVTFLHYVHNKIKIPCLPRFKVIDDGKIVGVITETDQFISTFIDETESKRNDGIFNIPIINTSDYNIADSEIHARLKDDPDRERYVKNIYLENNFYNVLRNIVRILINKYENIGIKESIISTIKRNDMLYLIKLSNIQALIRRLVSNYINFSDTHYSEEMLKNISEITTSCLVNKNPNTCSETKYCIKETDKEQKCKLVIPKTNLLNPSHDNEVLYIARMADEIIRYNRIRAFMFDRNIFPLMNVKYNLRDDEIILSQSMLSDDYLDNLIPVKENEYANFNTHDTTDPLLTELYESIFDTVSSMNIKCTTEITFLTQEYRKYFSSRQSLLKIIKFNSNSPKCSFEIILFILRLEAKRRERKRLETITINHLKIVLAQFYIDAIDKNYTEGIKERFARLLKYYGMDSISDEYRIKFIANEDDNFIETLPFFESYHLTRLDIWILANYYKIPIIVLYYPNKTLLETNDEFPILTTYYEEDIPGGFHAEHIEEKESLPFMGEAARPVYEERNPNQQGYYFIISPAVKTNTVPSYSIIFKKANILEEEEKEEEEKEKQTSVEIEKEYYIPLSILSQPMQASVIFQHSKQYINPDEPPHSEDDESPRMKESTRYKDTIIQFIQNFKPPSKRGRGDDSSSVGTRESRESPDTQEQELGADILASASVLGEKLKKSKKPAPRINVGIASSASALASAPASVVGKKAKGLSINLSSLKPPADIAVSASSVAKAPPRRKKSSGLSINLSSLKPQAAAEEFGPELSIIPETGENSD